MGNLVSFHFWPASVGGILSHLILPSSQGPLTLGELLDKKDAGFWQMPGALSDFRVGPEPSASSECP